MDPATAILLLGLCLGSFVCLNLLYITIPYAASGDADVVLPVDFWKNKELHVSAQETDERYAA